jgi:putative ubiquitin-RnfH superfamily antitoxin RatB of RatAB toxin-antitoxin module
VKVEVAYVGADFSACIGLDLPRGARVADAVEASGLRSRVGLAGRDLAYAVYGRAVAASRPLAEGDRVEITLPLVCDPVTRRHALAKKVRGLR